MVKSRVCLLWSELDAWGGILHDAMVLLLARWSGELLSFAVGQLFPGAYVTKLSNLQSQLGKRNE